MVSLGPLRAAVQSFLANPALGSHERCMAWVSAAVADGTNGITGELIDISLESGVEVLKLKEVILQNYLFCGFPAAIEGLIILHDRVKANGLQDSNYVETRTRSTMVEDGESLCRVIYGKTYDRLMEHMGQLSLDLAEWMIAEGYGKVLSRPVLTIRERELCVIAALSMLRKHRQLISHLRGAKKVGVSREEMIAVIDGNRLLTESPVVEHGIECLLSAGIVDGAQ